VKSVAIPLVVLACACSSAGPSFTSAPRAEGTRAPRTASCDELDPTRCQLPFPSNRFARPDPSSPTGIRVKLSLQDFGLPGDDTSFSDRADGFSRVSPVAFGIPGRLREEDAQKAMVLVAATPGQPDYGQVVPLKVEAVAETDDVETLLLGHPLRLLSAATDYVAVVTDVLRTNDGKPVLRPHAVGVALGAEAAQSQEEADLGGYHAPTRAALAKAGIAADHVVRVTEFTTRSAGDTVRRLRRMREIVTAATKAGTVTATVEKVEYGTDPSVELVAYGHFEGVPSFLTKNQQLSLDESSMPIQTGVQNAPFRVSVPKGTGDYHVLLFGHGAGGSYKDGSFDEPLASIGLAKGSYEFDGWTGDTLIPTVGNFRHAFSAVASSTARLMQSLASGAALDASLALALGDTLAAPELGGRDNPAKGRRPDMSIKVWGGGSMGGIMGGVMCAVDPELRYALLNVPGGGWMHFLPHSAFYDAGKFIVRGAYGSVFDARLALAMTQGAWDDVDGAVGAGAPADKRPVILIQESIDDPIVPNIGTNLLATAVGASLVGGVIQDIPGMPRQTSVAGGNGIVQFRVPFTSQGAVHGFADCRNPGGDAARMQMTDFLASAWAGSPLIRVPAVCPGGTCDFAGQWTRDCD
jgi:hypothetical protein